MLPATAYLFILFSSLCDKVGDSRILLKVNMVRVSGLVDSVANIAWSMAAKADPLYCLSGEGNLLRM